MLFFRGFLSSFQMKLYQIFGRSSGVRLSLITMLLCKSLGIRFSNRFWYWCMPCGFLRGVLGNWGSLKDMQWLPCGRPPSRGMTILLVSKLIVFNVFFSFLWECSGYRLLFLRIVSYVFDFEQLSSFVDFLNIMNIPPRRGHSQPRWAPIDEETALAPHISPLQGEP